MHEWTNILISWKNISHPVWVKSVHVHTQVKLLKDTLEAWKKEVEKKSPSMSVDDAYEVLNLPIGQGQ